MRTRPSATARPVRPTPTGRVELVHEALVEAAAHAVVVGPAQERLVGRVDELEDRPIRVEQPGRLVDDLLEDVGRVVDGRDAGRDLAQRPFGVGPPGDVLARHLELVDEPGVRQGDGRLLGDGEEQLAVGRAERVGAAGIGLRGRRGPRRRR